MKKLLCTIAFVCASGAIPASAAPLTLNFSGLSWDWTLNGAPVPDLTVVTFEAMFDSTGDTAAAAGVGNFEASSIVFQIGPDSYTVDPTADVTAYLEDPTGSFSGFYYAGLAVSGGTNFYVVGSGTANPAFDADTPTASVFGVIDDVVLLSFPLTIPLVGGGSLVMDGTAFIPDIPLFAELTPTTAVPEPTSLLLFGSGAIGVLARMRRRNLQ